MPVPVRPTLFRCPQCGWHKVTQPKSDVVIAGYDWFDRCPRCDCKPLESHTASWLDQLRQCIDKLG